MPESEMLYQTHVRIHLGNICSNIEGIRKMIGKQRKILIAVKANAYGHGAVEVSRMAEKIGVNWLGIATIPEAIQLRQSNITLPILKFSPVFPEEMAAALANKVTLSVCDRENIFELQKLSKQHQVVTPVHLKIDTGMGRIGVTPADSPAMAAYIENECPNLYLEGIFTHLPVSDTETNEFTINQIQLFQQNVKEIQQTIGRKVDLMHCANSGAVLGHPKAWFDMVRPGIMIYGFYPDQKTPHSIELKPGLSFYTRVSFIKKVSAGTSIGYGRTWIATEDTFIATIPVGYADGFNRLFSNSGRVLIKGKSYPVVGRVCMDQTMINLGRDTDIRVGDEVVLIGISGKLKIDGDEWAQKLDTITYEVTCQINSRVPRLFDPINLDG